MHAVTVPLSLAQQPICRSATHAALSICVCTFLDFGEARIRHYQRLNLHFRLVATTRHLDDPIHSLLNISDHSAISKVPSTTTQALLDLVDHPTPTTTCRVTW